MPAVWMTLAHLLCFAADVASEFVGARLDDVDALCAELRLDLRRIERGMCGGLDPRQRRRRRADRRHQADPHRGFESLEAQFVERRQIGCDGRPLDARRRQRLQLAGANVLQHRRGRREHELNLAAEQIRHRRRAAAVRDMQHLDARHHEKSSPDRCGEVPLPDDAKVIWPGLGLGGADQLVAPKTHRATGAPPARSARCRSSVTGSEVLGQIGRRGIRKGGVDRVRDGRDEQRVAVRGRRCNGLRGNVARCAGFVVHDEGLAQAAAPAIPRRRGWRRRLRFPAGIRPPSSPDATGSCLAPRPRRRGPMPSPRTRP